MTIDETRSFLLVAATDREQRIAYLGIRAGLRLQELRGLHATVVEELGRRAGIDAHLHSRLMRHAFADHVAHQAGVRRAQA